MIKVQDWIASIPDSDKHIAYVGEGKSEQREFLLCGTDWETYKDFTFYLDMAFDPTSITTHDHRQVVQTTHNSNQSKEEAGVILDEITTKETYTVDNVQMTSHDLTDISPLDKANTDEGIRLTWTILRHQTILPGKLWATIRAVDHEEQRIKKSAIMTFEVDAAICAVPATVPPVSEFEQMETRMGFIRQMTEILVNQAEDAAKSALNSEDNATRSAETATIAASSALNDMYLASAAADEAKQSAAAAATDATQAQTAAQQAATHARTAQQAASTAETHMKSAATQAASAALAAQGAELSSSDARAAVEVCSRYNLRSETAADNAEKSAADAKKYAEQASQGGGGSAMEYNRINVRDYGAVGDGVANDQPAIWAAITAAKALIAQDKPCELYLPAGTYGMLEGGMAIAIPQGKGGLRITGAGREITTIQYLEDWQPNSKYGGSAWYALEVHPAGGGEFSNYDTYIHDVTITGLTIRDDYPDKHATHTAKGTATTAASGEENHGINIGYCIRAAVTDCCLINLGDEVIDIYSCEDTIVMNNHIEGCPAAGPGGGAITIADGSKGAVVSGNTITRTGANYVLTADDFGGADGITLKAGVIMSGSVKLPDGTVIDRYTKLTEDTFIPIGTTLIKSNYAVAVESLYIPVSDVVITGNTIRDIHGKAMNLGCPNDGSAITNVIISNNVMSGCDDGIRFSGTHLKRSVKIHNNIFADIAGGAIEANAIEDMTVCGNTFRSISGTYAVGANGYAGNSRQLYANNVFEDIKYSAIVTAGMVLIKDCLFNGVGTAPQPATVYPAITKQDGTMTVSGCVMKNVRISSTSGGGGGVKSGIQGANVVEHTDIELIAKNGVANAGGEALSMVGSVIGGTFGGRINVTKENAIVQGVTIVSSNIGAHAITVATNGVSVTSCNINVNTASSKGAIGENSGCNYNLFANNITNRPIYTVGAQTVVVNNINTGATA